MAAFSKQFLSGSTDGQPIAVATTATPGTLIHTADATANDEIWIYGVNNSNADRLVTFEFGGVTASDLITVSLKRGDKGLVLLIPGLILTNSKIVRAFAAIANTVNLVGYVNRIN